LEHRKFVAGAEIKFTEPNIDPKRSLTSSRLLRIFKLQRQKKMSKKVLQQKDVIVKLIVGAGQASPSPPVGPALGSKGVKSMDFCKVHLRPTLSLYEHILM